MVGKLTAILIYNLVHQPILTLVHIQRLCPETFIDLNVSLRILFSKNAFNEEFEDITQFPKNKTCCYIHKLIPT